MRAVYPQREVLVFAKEFYPGDVYVWVPPGGKLRGEEILYLVVRDLGEFVQLARLVFGEKIPPPVRNWNGTEVVYKYQMFDSIPRGASGFVQVRRDSEGL